MLPFNSFRCFVEILPLKDLRGSTSAYDPIRAGFPSIDLDVSSVPSPQQTVVLPAILVTSALINSSFMCS